MEHEKLIKYIFTSIITDDETFMNDIAFGRLNNLEYTSLWYDIYQVFFLNLIINVYYIVIVLL